MMATQPAPLYSEEYASSNVEKKTIDDSSVEEVYHSTFDALQTKRLLRKVDWHLIPFLSLLYLLSFLE